VIRSRRESWERHIARTGEVINAIKILVGKREGKRPLGRTRRRQEDSIKMDVKETGWEVVGWMHLVQGRNQWRAPVNTVVS
jgi:hypothetical protein